MSNVANGSPQGSNQGLGSKRIVDRRGTLRYSTPRRSMALGTMQRRIGGANQGLNRRPTRTPVLVPLVIVLGLTFYASGCSDGDGAGPSNVAQSASTSTPSPVSTAQGAVKPPDVAGTAQYEGSVLRLISADPYYHRMPLLQDGTPVDLVEGVEVVDSDGHKSSLREIEAGAVLAIDIGEGCEESAPVVCDLVRITVSVG